MWIKQIFRRSPLSANIRCGSMRHMSRRQFIKRDVMQRHTWQTAAFLGVLLTTAAAASRSDPAVLKADIPFPFVVANHTLPAGHYEVSTLGEQTIRIANAHKQGAFVLTSKAAEHSPESSGKLVFYRYQATYFLAQVWGPGKGTGKQLYKSRAEEELERKGISKEIAVLRAEK
jgi:hypothetical protein